jgi:hypothetical protein
MGIYAEADRIAVMQPPLSAYHAAKERVPAVTAIEVALLARHRANFSDLEITALVRGAVEIPPERVKALAQRGAAMIARAKKDTNGLRT